MKKYTYMLVIEANSKPEADEKMTTFLKVVSEYKKFTFNDVLEGIVYGVTTFFEMKKVQTQRMQQDSEKQI